MAFTTQAESLSWGKFTLHGPGSADNGPFDVEVRVSSSLGNPGAIVESVADALGLGQVTRVAGWDVRPVSLDVRLSAADGEQLALVEAALRRQAEESPPPPLVWVPPLGLSAPVAFDAQVVELARVFDAGAGWDFEEKHRGERDYRLTFRCRPFVRSLDPVLIPTVAAPPAVPTEALVNNCDSTTTGGWGPNPSSSGPGSGTRTGDTYVDATRDNTPIGNESHVVVIHNDPISLGGLPYLRVRMRVGAHDGAERYRTWKWKARLWEFKDGERHFFDFVAQRDLGYAVEYWIAPGNQLDSLSCGGRYDGGGTWADHGFVEVYDLTATDALPTSGTTRQQSRIAPVRGSVETEATVRVYDTTPDELGKDVLIHTSRNLEWQPPLRPWLVSSDTVTADMSLVSGGFHSTTTVDAVYRIPALSFTPGAYVLMARIDANSVSMTWEAKMTDSAGVEHFGQGGLSGQSATVDLSAPSGYQVVVLSSRLLLPPMETNDSDAHIQITLSGTTNVDEVWLFGLDDGDLTWLYDPGADLDWVEARAAAAAELRPSVWGGIDSTNRGDGTRVDHFAGAGALGRHRFKAGEIQIFTVTSGSQSAQCELEYHPRYDHHVVGADLVAEA